MSLTSDARSESVMKREDPAPSEAADKTEITLNSLRTLQHVSVGPEGHVHQVLSCVYNPWQQWEEPQKIHVPNYTQEPTRRHPKDDAKAHVRYVLP